ncbi:MAG: hypothetical protein LLG44_02575 [Chloroflexi bacterium]|nr:hypothetical protein [Chloroflexota bacterium]
MANCPACGAEVASNVSRCPNCHTGLVWRSDIPASVWKSKATATIWKVIITLIVIAIVVMAAILILRG